jgi:hypothetical protein
MPATVADDASQSYSAPASPGLRTINLTVDRAWRYVLEEHQTRRPIVISCHRTPSFEIDYFVHSLKGAANAVLIDGGSLSHALACASDNEAQTRVGEIVQSVDQGSLTLISNCDRLLDCQSGQRVLSLGDAHPTASSGTLCYLFRERPPEQEEFYWRQSRPTRYTFFHLLTMNRDTSIYQDEFSEQIRQLVALHLGSCDPAICENLAGDIARLFRGPEVLPGPSGQLRLRDPTSNLIFLPEPTRDYASYVENGGQRLKPSQRDPIDFLMKAYESYLRPRLLYSGHLLKVDIKLYRALEYLAIKRHAPLMDFLRGLNVLTPKELEDPPAQLKHQVYTIRSINGRLVFPGFSQGLMKSHLRRTRLLALDRGTAP